jgi:hypothetical protein
LSARYTTGTPRGRLSGLEGRRRLETVTLARVSAHDPATRLGIEDGEERFGGGEPLGVARRQGHHRPVAAEDEAIGPEVLEEMVDVRPQSVDRPVGPRLGHQPRELDPRRRLARTEGWRRALVPDGRCEITPPGGRSDDVSYRLHESARPCPPPTARWAAPPAHPSEARGECAPADST